MRKGHGKGGSVKTLQNVHQSPNAATYTGLDEWDCITFTHSAMGLLTHSPTRLEGSRAGSVGGGETRGTLPSWSWHQSEGIRCEGAKANTAVPPFQMVTGSTTEIKEARGGAK